MTTNYLLDTNALSEASKKNPDKAFMQWLTVTDELALYTSCIVIGEIKKGVTLVSDSKKQGKFGDLLNEIMESFGDRVVEIDKEVALRWGELMATGQQAGKTPPAIDTLIAAQCLCHGLTLVTRNTKDFNQFTGLSIFSPWSD